MIFQEPWGEGVDIDVASTAGYKLYYCITVLLVILTVKNKKQVIDQHRKEKVKQASTLVISALAE